MRFRRPLLLLTAAAVGAAPVAVALEGPSTTSATGFSQEIVLNDASGATTGGAEPSIEVDSHGSVYVSAPVGVPSGGCPFWEVLPDTGEVRYRGTIDTDRFSVGGGDCDISLTDNPAPGAEHDIASITSLSLANLTSNKTSDGGATFETIANPAAQQVFGVDRQWQAADRSLDRHYLTVHDLATLNIQTAVSTDGGYTYVSNRPVIDPTVTPQALATGVAVRGVTGGNSFGTTVVDETTHKLYVPFAAPKGDTFEHNTIYVAEGDPCATLPCVKGEPAGPISWKVHEVHSEALPLEPGKDDLGTGFPAIAIDRGGTVWVGWTGDPSSASTNRVYVSRMSTPRDATSWVPPVPVDRGTAHSNLFPWLVAGEAGRAGIAWYSATTSSSCVGSKGPTDDTNDECKNDWTVQYADTYGGDSWSSSQVSDGLVHEGAICTGGLGCPAGTRTLLDFFDVAVDALGRPNFAYNSDEREPGTPDIHYTRQCSGTTLTGAVLDPDGSCRITGDSPGSGGTASPSPTPDAPPGQVACVTSWDDPVGDATTAQTGAPGTGDANLDLVQVDLSSTTEELTVVLHADALSESPSDLGDEFGLEGVVGGAGFEVYADRTHTGLYDGAGVFGTGFGSASATYDVDASTVTVSVPLTSLAEATGTTVDALIGARLSALSAFTSDTLESVPLLMYDTAATTSEPLVGAVCPDVDASSSASPTPTPSPDLTGSSPSATPAAEESATPTPSCTSRGNGSSHEDKDKDKEKDKDCKEAKG